MATHDYNIANQTGANFRADLNNALAAIVSNNYGSTDPATVLDAGINGQCQWWADSATGLLKLRNTGDTDWVVVGTLNSQYLGLAPTHYFRLNSNRNLITAGTAGALDPQSLFGVGAALSASTIYEFELLSNLSLINNAALTDISIGFSYTGSFTDTVYQSFSGGGASTTSANPPDGYGFTTTAAITDITPGTGDDYRYLLLKGTMSTNTAGTITPQIEFDTLTSSPAVTPIVLAGSYIKLRPIGTSGSNVNIGGWA